MLTLSEVLKMPVVRSADPEVVAGSEHLTRPVRWVHTTELADIGPLLRGGDLVLTTGIALPDSRRAWTEFVRSLVDSEAAGLFVELGRRWRSLPDGLVEECVAQDLPLVALRREVRFAAITQAVGERLVDEQVAELRDTRRVHETFTELSISEAGPPEILKAAQELSGATVVLESEDHRVLDYRAGPEDVAAFLDDWERRSRSVIWSGRTTWDPSNGWLVTRVGRRERGWGRLVIDASSPPSDRLTVVAERAAAALAMHRLRDRNRDSQLRRLHHELIVGLLTDASDAETLRRAGLAGIPVENRHYVGIALRMGRRAMPGISAAELDELVTWCLRSAEAARATALVAAFESEVRMLLAVPRRADPVRLTDKLVQHVRDRLPVVAAAGTPVTRLQLADRTLREATQVLASVAQPRSDTAVHRLEDVHIRGLLTMLADDDRLRAFSERQLAPLRDPDQPSGPSLLAVLQVLIEHWDRKSRAAELLNLSRPVLYDRIARIEQLLGVSLADAEIRTSLHVALIHSAEVA